MKKTKGKLVLSALVILTVSIGLVGCGTSNHSKNDSAKSLPKSNITQQDLDSAIAQAQNKELESRTDNYTKVTVKDYNTNSDVSVKIPNTYAGEYVQSEEVNMSESLLCDYNGIEDAISISVSTSYYNWDKGQSGNHEITNICNNVNNEVLVPMQTESGATCIVKNRKSGKVTAYRYLNCASDGYYIRLSCTANITCYMEEKELLDILKEIKIAFD